MKVYEVLQVVGGLDDSAVSVSLHASLERAKASLGPDGWALPHGIDLCWKKIGRATFTIRERLVEGA